MQQAPLQLHRHLMSRKIKLLISTSDQLLSCWITLINTVGFYLVCKLATTQTGCQVQPKFATLALLDSRFVQFRVKNTNLLYNNKPVSHYNGKIMSTTTVNKCVLSTNFIQIYATRYTHIYNTRKTMMNIWCVSLKANKCYIFVTGMFVQSPTFTEAIVMRKSAWSQNSRRHKATFYQSIHLLYQ